MHEIFISHSSKDKDLITVFGDMILKLGMGFTENNIFCTSLDGSGIDIGENWRNTIREELVNAKVVILFITPNYKESEICLNEMGAAWVSDAKVIPVIVPPVDYKTIGVVFDVNQAVLLTKDTDLDNLKDSLDEFAPIKKLSSSNWTTKKKESATSFEQIIKKSPFQAPLSRDEFIRLKAELKDTNDCFNNLVAEKRQLTEAYEELKKLKDKSDVELVERNSGLTDEYDDFLAKAQEVGKAINEFGPAVRTIIFNNFTGNGLNLTSDDSRAYNDELRKALAKQIIYDGQKLNQSNKRVRNALKIVADFEDFFNTGISEETYSKLEEKYEGIEIDINSSDFWEQVLGVESLLF